MRGLDREGVGEFIERSAGFEPSREQLDLFMRETDGNPFFLSETVAAMLEAGTLDERTYDLATPDGVREALSRRVNELPEDAVELLKLAAIAGYEFDFTTLSIISDVDENRQLELIENALDERVIAEGSRPGTYRFVYEPMQRVLLDEMSSTRRLRFHGTIAEQLEQSYGPRAEEHASELARHYAESAALNAAHVEPALKYSMAAGAEASERRAWLEARHLHQTALSLADRTQSTDASRAAILTQLASAEARLPDVEAALEHAQADIELWLRANEPREAAQVALAIRSLGAPAVGVELAQSVVSHVGGVDLRLEAELHAWIALAFRERPEGEHAAARAQALAAEGDMPGVAAALAYREGEIALWSQLLAAPDDLFHRARDLFLAAGDRETANWAQFRVAEAMRLRGELGAAEQVLGEAARQFEQLGNLAANTQLDGQLGLLAILRWDENGFAAIRDRPGRRPGIVDSVLEPRRREVRGEIHSALAIHQRAITTTSTLEAARSLEVATRARLHHLLGHNVEARAALVELPSLETFPDDDSGRDRRMMITPRAVADQAFIDLMPDEVARAFELPISEQQRSNQFGSLDRARATWALALEEFEEAELLARAGLEWTQRERCPVEEGRCHQLLADILERRGEAREAAVHLDAAGDLFSAHGARLYLDQVLEKKDLLKA